MEVRNIPIKDIKPYENNPRNNKDAVEKVAESIKEFGWKQPIVIDKNGVIIAGHTRYKAAQKLGIVSVPVVCADDLTEEQVKAYRLADNKTAGFSTWDMDLLELELEGLQAISFDMARFGFEETVLEPQEIKEDEFETDKVLEEIKTPISRKGDIWHLGMHRLRCGDSTSQADVDCLMDGQKARLIVTDAPYNVNYNNEGNANNPRWKKSEGIMNDNMSTEDFREFLRKAFTCASNAVEPGAVMFAFMSAQEWPTIDGVMREIGWHWSSSIIWVKDSLVLGRKDFQPRYESIWYGWQEGTHRLYPLKEDRTQTDVWEFDKPKRNLLHPTQKPLDVIGKAITLCSKNNDIVLDLFGGSASTLIAADQLGRVAYLQELDEKYVDVSVRRFVEYKGSSQGVYLLRDGQKAPYDDVIRRM